MEELNLSSTEALGKIKELVFTGVPLSGSIANIDKQKEVIEKLFETVENALDLEQKQDGE